MYIDGMTEYCEQSPLTGVFRSQAETVGLPMTNEHNIGWGFTARQRLRFERIGTGLAKAVFLGCALTENFP